VGGEALESVFRLLYYTTTQGGCRASDTINVQWIFR
jgi:hypothetical protein